MVKFRALVVLSVLTATLLAGCAAQAEELPNAEWACQHFAAVNEKLSTNYQRSTVGSAGKWQEARTALDDTIEMANGDLSALVAEAQNALPDSNFGDVSAFNSVVVEIAAACDLPDDGGYEIHELIEG